jgi:hypothetical protein
LYEEEEAPAAAAAAAAGLCVGKVLLLVVGARRGIPETLGEDPTEEHDVMPPDDAGAAAREAGVSLSAQRAEEDEIFSTGSIGNNDILLLSVNSLLSKLTMSQSSFEPAPGSPICEG